MTKSESAEDRARRVQKFCMACSTTVITYIASSPDRGYRGTGFYVRCGERLYVVTNTHVLEKYCCLKKKGLTAAVQVATGYGCPGIEEHAGYLLMPHKTSVIDEVESEHDHLDIGLIEVKPKYCKEVSKSKSPLSVVEPAAGLPAVDETVFFRGYPKPFLCPDPYAGPPGLRGTGFTYRSSVISVHERLLKLRWSDNNMLLFPEDAEKGLPTSPDLHGTSGSAVFDGDCRLLGVLWGGDEQSIYVVPAAHIATCILEYVKQQYGTEE